MITSHFVMICLVIYMFKMKHYELKLSIYIQKLDECTFRKVI